VINVSKFKPGNFRFVIEIEISVFERLLSEMVGTESFGIPAENELLENRNVKQKTKNTKMEYALNLIEQISSKHSVFRRISFAW
jgi:hypothetical protein